LWGNAAVPFLPMAADLDAMLERADAAIVIGDPALMALEERANRFERSDEDLVYHDLAEEWGRRTGLPFVSAVWAAAPGTEAVGSRVVEDLIRSRDHGLMHVDRIAREWSGKIPLTEETIHTYLTANIHYVLDEECLKGMRGFFRMAAEAGVLPGYELPRPAVTA
jgi:chorismate dehydratase